MERIVERVISRLLVESDRNLEIHVFDFDDTLVRTNSKIHVTSGGEKFSLTPKEYANYRRQPGDSFDYSDFEEVIEPKIIPSTFINLKTAIDRNGKNNVFILTARGNQKPIEDFLDSVGVGGIRVFAVGTSDPQAKASVIENEVLSRNTSKIRRVYFYDDAMKNINAVRNLRKRLPGVDVITIRMK